MLPFSSSMFYIQCGANCMGCIFKTCPASAHRPPPSLLPWGPRPPSSFSWIIRVATSLVSLLLLLILWGTSRNSSQNNPSNVSNIPIFCLIYPVAFHLTQSESWACYELQGLAWPGTLLPHWYYILLLCLSLNLVQPLSFLVAPCWWFLLPVLAPHLFLLPGLTCRSHTPYFLQSFNKCHPLRRHCLASLLKTLSHLPPFPFPLWGSLKNLLMTFHNQIVHIFLPIYLVYFFLIHYSVHFMRTRIFVHFQCLAHSSFLTKICWMNNVFS